ncbi:MAG: hypothetical protein E6H07_04580 [Bacteroidetes bacterium]|nr:MAG: hypothetical protein E6H07_04580 [Bacteroidota bacterium]
MEVHHHSHTSRKKWTHYFWEFLMLFLAVFCGFLAEYQLEHKIEKDRENILAKAFFEDLKKDTAALHLAFSFSDKKLNACDTVLEMLHRPRTSWNDTNFYKSYSYNLIAYPFIATNGTYEQMKTSGSLRYFKQSLVNQMNAYDVQLKKTGYRDDVEDKGLWILATYSMDLLNIEVLSDIRFNKPITHDAYIKITDKDNIGKLINLVMMMKGFRTRTLQEYEAQLKIADTLLNALEKEYHLK